MKVYCTIKREACTCTPQTDLAAAGRMMPRVGCGFLPVVDAGRRVAEEQVPAIIAAYSPAKASARR
jgi:CBS domain-containing protein